MGCACGNKNQSATALAQFKRQGIKPKTKSLSLKSVDCKYTFEEISEKYETVTKLAHKKYLKNALLNYAKNCNLFNSQLDRIFDNK